MRLFGAPNVSKLAAKGDLKGLIKALGYQRDWRVRRQAVVALKEMGGARAIEALGGALDDSNSTVRDEAAQALKTFGVSSVEPLVGAPSDGVSGARDPRADVVGQSGDAQTVEVSPAALVEPAAPRMAAGRARMFRLFVSSTFDDFELERDTLRERVWPRLEQFCEQRGARFQAVDLRWGVGSEAAADQQTMNICLGGDRALPTGHAPAELPHPGRRPLWLVPAAAADPGRGVRNAGRTSVQTGSRFGQRVV